MTPGLDIMRALYVQKTRLSRSSRKWGLDVLDVSGFNFFWDDYLKGLSLVQEATPPC